MYRHNAQTLQRIEDTLLIVEEEHFPLPGIELDAARRAFAMQVVDSIRRVEFVSVVSQRPISPRRANPNEEMFDPVRAAILAHRRGNVDEACWITFLFVHFGMHPIAKWRFLREVYGKLGEEPGWTWANVSRHPDDFRDWLRANQEHLLRGRRRGFGNHRKYQSMDADSPTGTGAAVLSYVDWVLQGGGHAQLIANVYADNNNDDYAAFDSLYNQMDAVISFGRIAKFDYLTMLGKLAIARIKPPKAYVADSTGPKNGAKLMLQGNVGAGLSSRELECRLRVMGDQLGVNMQVIEDSLCNWQKSPERYRLFAG
ncbi:alpha-glutamyl/putrescinyl thymine pyrophosphorylase clade 3 protein [Lacisediminimonas profundi]|uniref:alpha-glutamyl/putrescinyl thymine pyrophosphorylase clade 3 protein n=1 Tax=Lacisediminimonas profundi TaxID=2603856 RepID=UPI00124B9B57|nr:hypothetical protein [Lacisediminimonas profundi]